MKHMSVMMEILGLTLVCFILRLKTFLDSYDRTPSSSLLESPLKCSHLVVFLSCPQLLKRR